MKDGNYTIEVLLSGGSGKAYIESPANVQITDGEIQAEIVWSSSNYDYMEIDGAGYYPINNDGNSVFIIDIDSFEGDIPLLAETVAMSKPRMIEYTLSFDSDTLKSSDFSLAPAIFAGAAVLIVAAVALFTIKRKKKLNEKNS